jgi:hypothetical protein
VTSTGRTPGSAYRDLVPSFLSPAWISALAAVLAEATFPAADSFTSLTVRQVVSTGPHGDEIDYRITLSDRGIGVVSGSAGSDPPADLTLLSDYDTAAAISRGELSAQEALESGRLEVRGRVDRITGARKVLVALGDAARELRASTTYDPGP